MVKVWHYLECEAHAINAKFYAASATGVAPNCTLGHEFLANIVDNMFACTSVLFTVT